MKPWETALTGILLSFCSFPVLLGQSRHASLSNEVVRLVSVRDENGAKRIVMRGAEGTYVFCCNLNGAGCITPIPGKRYWLLTSASPVGKMDINWLKYWYVEYHDATNMGIVPAWKEWRDGWSNAKDSDIFMDQYSGVGAYWLMSFTAVK